MATANDSPGLDLALAPTPETAPQVLKPSPAKPQPVVTPLAPERYKIQVTVSGETCAKLRRAQDLLRHRIPNGDPAVVLDLALAALLKDLEKTKLASTRRSPKPRTPSTRKRNRRSRHIPAAVKRAVFERDGGRCAFVGSAGRCSESGFLEFHHLVPYAAGGEATVESIELRCRAHNLYEAETYFPEALHAARPKRDSAQKTIADTNGPTWPGPS